MNFLRAQDYLIAVLIQDCQHNLSFFKKKKKVLIVFGINDCTENSSIPWLLLMFHQKEICLNSLVYNCPFLKTGLLCMPKIEWLLLNKNYFPWSVLVKWEKNWYYITRKAISQCQKYRSTCINARAFSKL